MNSWYFKSIMLITTALKATSLLRLSRKPTRVAMWLIPCLESVVIMVIRVPLWSCLVMRPCTHIVLVMPAVWLRVELVTVTVPRGPGIAVLSVRLWSRASGFVSLLSMGWTALFVVHCIFWPIAWAMWWVAPIRVVRLGTADLLLHVHYCTT